MDGGVRPTASRRRLAVVVLVLTTIVVASVGYAAAQPAYLLVVSDPDSGERLVTTPVMDGDTVTLSYMHSVERTPVEDVYTVDGTTLDNTEMRFQSYGWGLPAREEVERVDGWFVFDPDRRYQHVDVKPGHIAGHTLTVDDETIDLVSLSGGETVRLSVERRSLAARLLSA